MCLDRTVNRSRAPGRLDYIYWRDGRLLRTGKEHRSEDGVIKTEHRQRQYPRVRGDHDHTLEAEDHHPMVSTSCFLQMMFKQMNFSLVKFNHTRKKKGQ
ncbi:uncharacterized protein isoform X3 [Danio rerio]|uniref:Uncharacterized protein isoform X3 n=1 Tax=Danio rerio TaxID=7955 RepID=A0AC58J9L6_DANRE